MVSNRNLKGVRALLIGAVSLLATACAMLPDGRTVRSASLTESYVVCEGATASRIPSRQGVGETCRRDL
jgi:hypothetical protein